MRGLKTALFVAAACLSTPAMAQESVYDPWENTNRSLFSFHEHLDKAVFEPVARGYRAVTNEPVRDGVLNVLRNLRAPVVFVNDVLQGQPKRAGVTVARFGINSTIGLLGVLDPAESMGLQRHEEDFGQTLAVWGVPAGPYIFVPALGPTNVRDGAGRIVDIAFHPLTWSRFDGHDTIVVTRTVASAVAGRETVLDAVDDIRATSLDPYVSIRTSYGLLRESAIRNGRSEPESDGNSATDLNENEDVTQYDDTTASDSLWSQDANAPGVTPVTEEAPGAEQKRAVGGVQ
jgi:phospholipid-binding lipoprotein MlaA